MGCFQVRYVSRVVIYERLLFIRLATGSNQVQSKALVDCGVPTSLSALLHQMYVCLDDG